MHFLRVHSRLQVTCNYKFEKPAKQEIRSLSSDNFFAVTMADVSTAQERKFMIFCNTVISLFAYLINK